MSKTTRVLIFGTFDILHPGHIKLINFASKLGMISVALTPDELCKKYKGENPVNNFEERKNRLKKINLIDQVVEADHKPNSYNVLNKVKPNIIVLGYDQSNLKPNIRKKLAEITSDCKILIAPAYRTNMYKSSKLKTSLLQLV